MKTMMSVLGLSLGLLFSACNHSGVEQQQQLQLQAQQHTIDSMKMAVAQQHMLDSMAKANEAAVAKAKASAAASKRVTTHRSSSRSYARNSVNRYTGYTQQPVQNIPVQSPQQQRPKGWSAKAKGALIGAGVGAATGAVVNKRNRAAGAVIGGLLGAGAGTGVGAIIDKKNGR